MAMKIQLALQGGGAKIAALMAVMEAVQSLEQEGVLKISRLAGTSAGSLIGCLFAAGIPMQTLRASLLAGQGKDLLGLFPRPSMRQMMMQPILGRPFWSTTLLEKGLEKYFADEGMSQLKHLKTEVLIVAANLGTSAKEVYRGDAFIVSSIIDSCGLPYFFRTWDKNGGKVIVDGGICENLPSSELTETADEPVVAVTFQPTTPGTPRDVRSFTLALLETAMNNSIERAKKGLKETSIHTIETDITTFDFARGIEYGLRDKNVYGLAKRNAEDFFRKFVAQKLQEREINAAALKRIEQEELAMRKPAAVTAREQQDIGGDFWADQSPTTDHLMRQIGKVYEVQHSARKFKYSKCSFAVQANCLLQEGELLYGSPDSFSYRLTFQPVDEPIYCVSVALSPTPEAKFLGKTKWTLRDTENNIIESIDVAVRNPDQPEARELLLFFNPILRPGNGAYSLLFQDQAMLLMPKLLRHEKDVLEFCPRRATGTVDRIDLLLHVPERLKDSIYMEPQSKVHPGRPMTEGEVTDYAVPFGFHTLGWTGENLAAEEIFGVNVFYK